MTDVMVDLETWGTRAGCAIRSIGAVVFDPKTGALGDTFYRNITRGSCEIYDLTVDPETEAWWNKPENAVAQGVLSVGQVSLFEALGDFEEWVGKHGKIRFWARDPDFDATILRAAYDTIGSRIPWDFCNHRSVRTTLALADYKPSHWDGTYHNALDDARNQARDVIEAYRILGLAESLHV